MFCTSIVARRCLNYFRKGLSSTIEARISAFMVLLTVLQHRYNQDCGEMQPWERLWNSCTTLEATWNDDHEQCNGHKRCQTSRGIDFTEVHEPITQEQPQEDEDRLGPANSDLLLATCLTKSCTPGLHERDLQTASQEPYKLHCTHPLS